MKKLDQEHKKVYQEFNKMNDHLESQSKKLRFNNVVSALVLGIMVGLIFYLYVIGVIM